MACERWDSWKGRHYNFIFTGSCRRLCKYSAFKCLWRYQRDSRFYICRLVLCIYSLCLLFFRLLCFYVLFSNAQFLALNHARAEWVRQYDSDGSSCRCFRIIFCFNAAVFAVHSVGMLTNVQLVPVQLGPFEFQTWQTISELHRCSSGAVLVHRHMLVQRHSYPVEGCLCVSAFKSFKFSHVTQLVPKNLGFLHSPSHVHQVRSSWALKKTNMANFVAAKLAITLSQTMSC